MATAKQIKAFISAITPYIQKYAQIYGYCVASPIIAMACVESAYGLSGLANYHNYFGMKCGSSWRGASVNMATKEEYTVGTLTDIRANFRAYSSMEEGVKGFFDFISTSRYQNLHKAKSAREFLEMIKADGYATSSTYVKTNMNVVTKQNLEEFDTFEPASANIHYAMVTNCCFLNCRDKANGDVIGVFKRDSLLTVQDKSGAWWRVTGRPCDSTENITGYCSAKYLKEA